MVKLYNDMGKKASITKDVFSPEITEKISKNDLSDQLKSKEFPKTKELMLQITVARVFLRILP